MSFKLKNKFSFGKSSAMTPQVKGNPHDPMAIMTSILKE
jgi:hypothetical protein